MFMLMERCHVPVAIMVLLLVFFSLKSLEAQENINESSLPITITSDRMEGDFQGGIITFLNDVKVIRGEMVLQADKVKIHPKEGGEEIERIVAAGNVRVVTGSRSLISDQVEYLEALDLLILSGHAKVIDGQNTITGPLIRVYLKEDRAEVEGNTVERPKFLFHPDSQKKKK